MKLSALVLGTVLAAASASPAQDRLTADTLRGLELRGIGPAFMAGRIADVEKDPTDPSVWYVAVASGGVWKTVNNGTTWQPIFDEQTSYSIGCVRVDPRNPSVVWVGTGENNSQRSVGWGDGVYKSLDGGRSWKRVGLERSEHIGRIAIDPRDSDVVWVAAQGPLWAPGGDRGLYKTSDGGETWQASLQIGENTGVTDVVLDPRDPDVVYAASFQRRRRVWSLIGGGPESALYKSTDGGASWRKLSSGLPRGDMGRIGLALAPQDPDVVYATIAASDEERGFYRSLDRGESWEKRSDYVAVDPQYYQEIYPDPHRAQRLYIVDVWIQVSEDDGATWSPLNSRNKHVDNHEIVFDPEDPDYLLVGTDGGLYESWDRGERWRFVANLPVTQIYRVGLDDAEPFYNVYGGTQDNSSQGGPSRTATMHGITNRDWFITVGGDGYQTRVEPGNPDVLYSMSQYGGLIRFDRKSGEILDIQPQPESGDEPLRWHWDSPLLLSPHSPTRLYFAANRLFRSDDRGDSWQAISPDLSRGIDRNELEVMGRVWGADAIWKNVFTSFYGEAVALDESPLVEGLLYVGTDDGLIQVSEDGGGSWRRVGSFPGIPERTYVSDVMASRHEPDTVYALFNNHKSGDFRPYALVSRDRARTWSSIARGLPEGHPTWSIEEDHVEPGLLFLGTEFGLFFSRDGGERWIPLRGGVPPVAFRDLAIQRRESDLVAASFGRGFYVLDDYAPLRELSEELLANEAHLFEVGDAWAFVESQPLGYGDTGDQGDAFFTAPNPPFGAVFTFYLREPLESRREKRQKREKELSERGAPVGNPGWEELRAEDREEAPEVLLVVRDDTGSVVRRIPAPRTAGVHRVAWDLRYPRLDPIRLDEEEPRFGRPPAGPLAAPGRYEVQLARRVDGEVAWLGEPRSFAVVPLGARSLPEPDWAELLAFQRKAGRLQRAVLAAREVLLDVERRLPYLMRAIDETPGTEESLAAEARAIARRLAQLRQELLGDETVRRHNEPTLPSLVSRVGRVIGAQWAATSAPTGTHVRSYEVAAAAFETVLADLRRLVETDLVALEVRMDSAGSPWTPGRALPEWSPEGP